MLLGLGLFFCLFSLSDLIQQFFFLFLLQICLVFDSLLFLSSFKSDFLFLPLELFFEFLHLFLVLNVIWWIVIAHIIMSWLINFQVLNTRQPLVAQIWYGINRLLEPIYGPIRRVLPNMGGLDLAPLAVLIGVAVARIVLTNNAALFY